MVCGNADVVKDDVRGLGQVQAHLVLFFAQLDAAVLLDEEGGDALAGALGLVGPCEDDEILGVRGVGSEALGAVDDPLVGLLVVDSGGLEGCRVGTGLGLGQAEGTHGAGQDLVRPHLLLFIGHLGRQNAVKVASGACESECEACVDLADLLDDEALRHHVHAQAAPLFGDRQGEVSRFDQCLMNIHRIYPEAAVCQLILLDAGLQLVLYDLVCALSELSLFLGCKCVLDHPCSSLWIKK